MKTSKIKKNLNSLQGQIVDIENDIKKTNRTLSITLAVIITLIVFIMLLLLKLDSLLNTTC